jgi:hypothetical protein
MLLPKFCEADFRCMTVDFIRPRTCLLEIIGVSDLKLNWGCSLTRSGRPTATNGLVVLVEKHLEGVGSDVVLGVFWTKFL